MLALDDDTLIIVGCSAIENKAADNVTTLKMGLSDLQRYLLCANSYGCFSCLSLKARRSSNYHIES